MVPNRPSLSQQISDVGSQHLFVVLLLARYVEKPSCELAY